MLETKKQKVITIGLGDRQKKLLRVLLKHQENICRIREDSRRKHYYK